MSDEDTCKVRLNGQFVVNVNTKSHKMSFSPEFQASQEVKVHEMTGYIRYTIGSQSLVRVSLTHFIVLTHFLYISNA